MKAYWLVLILLVPGAVRADMQLELSNRTHAILYREGENVFWEKCGDSAPTRGCSHNEQGKYFSVQYDVFVRAVQTFYGLNDRYYGGVKGLANLETDLSALQRQLDQENLKAAELKRAESEMLSLARLREKTEKAERDILQYLEKDVDAVLNQKFQGQRFLIVDESFHPVVYLEGKNAMFVLSPPVGFGERAKACEYFGEHWTHVAGESEIRGAVHEAFRQQPTLSLDQPFRVWLGDATVGYYTRSWHNNYGDVSKVDTVSIEEMRNLNRILPNLSMVTNAYHSAVANVFDLAAKPGQGSVTEELEAGENSLLGTQHPVVCQRDFDFSDNHDGNYVNGEHFADFSIYHLEDSLQSMSKSVYVNRAEFFREVAKTLHTLPLRETDDLKVAYRSANARLFVLLSMEPVLEDIQSHFVDNYVLPDFKRAKDEWTHKLGAKVLSDLELTPATYRAAVSLLTYGLKASQNYLNADDKKVVEALLPVLGKALATGPSSVTEVSTALGAHKDLLDRLTGGRRVHGFGVMLTSIADYLETHH